jgi:short-subunit dehydrogenase
MYKNPKSILITGASSGIGAELAIQYADKGITLYLTGRNERRLNATKDMCEDFGAEVHILIADIKDAATIENWIKAIPRLDLVIANAGISAGTGNGGESLVQVKNIFDTNIYGVINTIHPAIETMKLQQSGQIAIISSLAGYRGLPSSPAYSASKAAVKIYGEALRGVLKKDDIGLTVITPGYIKTAMTAVNDFYMPFIIDVEKAADVIIKRLKKNPARIAFPLPLYLVIWLLALLPPCLTDPLFSLLPQKPSETD